MHFTNSYLRCRNMELDETTNTQNHAKSTRENHVKYLNIIWRDRKTTQWIREKTKVRDIMETVSKLKWEWAGHIARRTDNRCTTRITDWTPRGYTRKQGRQKTRWRDDLDSFNKRWSRIAADRKRWRELRKAYAQQRTVNG